MWHIGKMNCNKPCNKLFCNQILQQTPIDIHWWKMIKTCFQRRTFANRVNIILKEDVERLGLSGQEVTVKAGYARNFLYPKRLAVYATEANRSMFKKVEEQQAQDSVTAESGRIRKLITRKFKKSSLVLHRRVAGERSLYGSVSKKDIADEVQKQFGIVLGTARVMLPTAIKTTGLHRIPVLLADMTEEELEKMEAAASVVETTEEEEETEEEEQEEEEGEFRYIHAEDQEEVVQEVCTTSVLPVDSTAYLKLRIESQDN